MKLSGWKFMLVWLFLTICVGIGTWLSDLAFECTFGHPSVGSSHRSFTDAGLLALVVLLAYVVCRDKNS